MPVNSAQIAPFLLPGVRKIKGDYKQMDVQYARIFSPGTSQLAVERTISARYLPLAELKVSGGPTPFDTAAGVRYVYNHVHVAVGVGYSFTREALDDNLYKTAFNPLNLGLQKSFRATKEILAASVLNTGNVVNTQIGGDGLPLFATNHPVDGYTIPNSPTTQVALNETSLIMANNMIRRFRDNAGILIGAQGKVLTVPVELRHVAKRLTEAVLRPGSNDNDPNVIKENGDLREGYVAMDYLTSPYAWFVISNQGGLIYLERVPFESSMQVEFTTDNLLIKGYERYYLGYDDWRCGFGSFPLN